MAEKGLSELAAAALSYEQVQVRVVVVVMVMVGETTRPSSHRRPGSAIALPPTH